MTLSLPPPPLTRIHRISTGQVFDRCLKSAPTYGKGDEELAAKLASLRFLLPRHWCVDSLKDSGEWYSVYSVRYSVFGRLVCSVAVCLVFDR